LAKSATIEKRSRQEAIELMKTLVWILTLFWVGQVFAQPVLSDPHADVNNDGFMNAADILGVMDSWKTGRGPWIEIDRVPFVGEFDDLSGQVGNVDFLDFRVAVYLREAGNWWTKPYEATRTVGIVQPGVWFADVTTGGTDEFATDYAVFVIPSSSTPPLCAPCEGDLPAIPDAMAMDRISRPEKSTLRFAGYPWVVKEREVRVGPGPNYFSTVKESVRVDGQSGDLRLSIEKQEDGYWSCAEVYSRKSWGYGTYVFRTEGRLDLLDRNVVFGMFTWDPTAPEAAHRELDFEFTRWSYARGDPNDPDPGNAQFVVHYCNDCGTDCNLYDRKRYELDQSSGGETMTHFLVWSPQQVVYRSYLGDRFETDPAELPETTMEWTSNTHVPAEGRENIRFNLWLNNGFAPSDGNEVEVTISGFKWQEGDIFAAKER
jgi:hypothetical protein